MAQNIYAAVADLAVPSKALADMSTDAQNTALSWASSVADGYIRKRFNLPLLSWTQSLTQAVADMATWKLMKARGFNPDSESTKVIMGAYRDALDWLEDVANNKVDPAFVDSSGAGQNEANAATNTVAEKPFVAYGNGGSGWDSNTNGGGGDRGGFWG